MFKNRLASTSFSVAVLSAGGLEAAGGVAMNNDNGGGTAYQCTVVNLHGIDQYRILRADTYQLQAADGLHAVKGHHPKMFTITIQLAVTAENGLKDL